MRRKWFFTNSKHEGRFYGVKGFTLNGEPRKPIILNENDDKIFKVEAQGYTFYIQAPTKEDAHLQLTRKIGRIPDSLLTWTEVKKVPKGEEFL